MIDRWYGGCNWLLQIDHWLHTMNFTELIKSAARSMTAHKRRSALTMLGIVIGIGAVVMIMSVGRGAQSLLQNQVASIGSNLVVILPGASDDNGPPAQAFGISVTTLKRDDLDVIERELPEIEVGDILVIQDSGAHGHAMGFQYNGKLRSAELLLREDGSVVQIRRAETFEDYVATIDFEGVEEFNP